MKHIGTYNCDFINLKFMVVLTNICQGFFEGFYAKLLDDFTKGQCFGISWSILIYVIVALSTYNFIVTVLTYTC